jgi:hypothetical protein
MGESRPPPPSPTPPPPPAYASSEPRTAPFPVLMLAHKRPARLNRTLSSLLAVRGLDRSQVFVVQDGGDAAVSRLVKAAGLHLVRGRKRDAGLAGRRVEGGALVARAYRRALSLAFDELTTDEALLVVEDDLLFAPDLMEYMLAGWSVQRADPTLWCVSAWNDNGFRGLVREPKRVLRTGYFPGLGWLLSRALYKGELEGRWPLEHWDHWMRSERKFRTGRGRECLVPHVPRTYHHGVEGTFMDRTLHDKYFARIAISTDSRATWPVSEWAGMRERLSAIGCVT